MGFLNHQPRIIGCCNVGPFFGGCIFPPPPLWEVSNMQSPMLLVVHGTLGSQAPTGQPIVPMETW